MTVKAKVTEFSYFSGFSIVSQNIPHQIYQEVKISGKTGRDSIRVAGFTLRHASKFLLVKFLGFVS